MFGINPWRLLAWMGHKSITTTMGYVHLAGDHMRPLAEELLTAAGGEIDPDRRIVRMLGARIRVSGTIAAHERNSCIWNGEGGPLKMRKPSAF